MKACRRLLAAASSACRVRIHQTRLIGESLALDTLVELRHVELFVQVDHVGCAVKPPLDGQLQGGQRAG